MPPVIDPKRYWSHGLRVKICGITSVEQGVAIATLGPQALGFICVPSSPRYITPTQIDTITAQLPPQTPAGSPLARIGVFANATLDQIQHTAETGNLTGIQLHGSESPQFCQHLRTRLPHHELIKAFRIRTPDTLNDIAPYHTHVDAILLDAYTETDLGGTGSTWDWAIVRDFSPPCPWFLAGGLTPQNITQALTQVHPTGIDLSSGVEIAPGNKDLNLVQQLFAQLYGERGIG